MKFTSYADAEDIALLPPCVDEVIIPPLRFSRLGNLHIDEAVALAEEVSAASKRAVFEWDVIMSESVARQLKAAFVRVDRRHFAAVRLCDVGALKFVRDLGWPVQLNLEGGNHNLRGIRRWIELAGRKLERLVCSFEIDRFRLGKYLPAIGVETELLGLGPIALFYTPRNLLSAALYGADSPAGGLRALAHDQEGGIHRDYRVVEGASGTLMFHAKDLNLLGEARFLADAGLDYMRLDLRHMPPRARAEVYRSLDSPDGYVHTRPHTKGLFGTNRSDVLFKKLKNPHLCAKEGDVVGEVVDVRRRSYMGFVCRIGGVSIGTRLAVETPEGKRRRATVEWLKDFRGGDVGETGEGGLFYMNHVPGTSVRTRLRIDSFR